MTLYWVLLRRLPVPATAMEWARWMEDHPKDRTVKRERVGPRSVSTVFLGINHDFSGTGEPILFETMVFGLDTGDVGEYMTRCSTWEEAERMHEAGVRWARTMASFTKDDPPD